MTCLQFRAQPFDTGVSQSSDGVSHGKKRPFLGQTKAVSSSPFHSPFRTPEEDSTVAVLFLLLSWASTAEMSVGEDYTRLE